MRTASGAVAIMAVTIALTVAPAHADPDPTPSVPYQVPTPDGPVLPGNAPLPPICAYAMQTCGYSLDPGTWTWQPRGTGTP
jgi:hypothetical protein